MLCGRCQSSEVLDISGTQVIRGKALFPATFVRTEEETCRRLWPLAPRWTWSKMARWQMATRTWARNPWRTRLLRRTGLSGKPSEMPKSQQSRRRVERRKEAWQRPQSTTTNHSPSPKTVGNHEMRLAGGCLRKVRIKVWARLSGCQICGSCIVKQFNYMLQLFMLRDR